MEIEMGTKMKYTEGKRVKKIKTEWLMREPEVF